MGKEFEIVREVELPGTPEAVFQAVSTNEGNAFLAAIRLAAHGPTGIWNQ